MSVLKKKRPSTDSGVSTDSGNKKFKKAESTAADLGRMKTGIVPKIRIPNVRSSTIPARTITSADKAKTSQTVTSAETAKPSPVISASEVKTEPSETITSAEMAKPNPRISASEVKREHGIIRVAQFATDPVTSKLEIPFQSAMLQQATPQSPTNETSTFQSAMFQQATSAQIPTLETPSFQSTMFQQAATAQIPTLQMPKLEMQNLQASAAVNEEPTG